MITFRLGNWVVLAGVTTLLCAASAIAQTSQTHEVQPTGEYAKIDTSGSLRDLRILAGKDTAAKDTLVQKIIADPGSYTPPVLMSMGGYLHSKNERELGFFWFCFGRADQKNPACR